jgi:uncharacterized protein YeaO (DUF488 family)
MIRIKRVYEAPARADGRRILVERLWPRGMKKEALVADGWMKEVAPTTELRRWFNHQPERWERFRERYAAELAANAESLAPLRALARKGTVTLLYSAHDADHNSAVVLCDFLRKPASRGRR